MRKLTAVILALCLLSFPIRASGDTQSLYDYCSSAAAGQKALAGLSSTERLLSQDDFPAGSSVCDWTAIAFSLLGIEDNYKAFLKETNEYISAHFPAPEGRRPLSATDRQALCLTVAALGGDPTHCGRNGKIDLIALGTYDYDGQSLGDQGLNGWIFALIALDSRGCEVPAGSRYTRGDMLEAILSAQENDGGFGLISGSSSVDITAMALQALAPYADEHRAAVDAALSYLSGELSDNALYLYGNEASSESSSQVIIALASLGIDPEEAADFTIDGVNILDGLLSFRRSDGSFAHTPSDTEGNMMATEQAMLALISVMKLRGGEGRLYDLTGVKAEKSGSMTAVLCVCAAAAAGGITVIAVRKGKKHE